MRAWIRDVKHHRNVSPVVKRNHSSCFRNFRNGNMLSFCARLTWKTRRSLCHFERKNSGHLVAGSILHEHFLYKYVWKRRETFIAKKVSSKITGCNLSSGYANDWRTKGFSTKIWTNLHKPIRSFLLSLKNILKSTLTATT